MAFSGIDIRRLRALAREMEWDTVPSLHRNATIALDTLETQGMHALSDSTAFAITTVASELEDAAADLVRRAALVEAAEQLDAWAATMPASVGLLVTAQALAVTSGPYTGNTDGEIAAWIAARARQETSRVLSRLQPAITSGDVGTLRAVADDLSVMLHEPWFQPAMAAVFDRLGPRGAARLVQRLVTVPVQHYDDPVVINYAVAFSAATRAGLSWTAADVAHWFEHGPAGAAQLLRAGDLDPAFMELLIATVGLDGYAYTAPEPIPGIRHALSAGSDIWHHVGPRAADPRAVIIDALGDHPRLALSTLQQPGVVESLVEARWPLDQGAAIGELLAGVARRSPSDPMVGDLIQRTLDTASRADISIPMELRPALADLAGAHMGDLALSLAIGDEVTPTAQRPGLELPAHQTRRLIRLVAEHDAAFSTLVVAYGRWVDDLMRRQPDDYLRHATARADEVGALTFALAYTDRDVRMERAEGATSGRLSALHVLETLASTGVALLPGPTETATAFAVERVLQQIENDIDGVAPDALAEHNEWKERMLADLEYLLAVEMNARGLLDRRIDTTGLSRLEFLYLVEGADGPLERIMTIIEAQARRQREAIAETG